APGSYNGLAGPTWWVAGPPGLWQVPMAFPNPTGDVPLQFAGTWHVAAAASNCSVFLKMKDGMKSSITTISFTPEGDLVLGLCHVARPGTIWGPLAAQEKRDLHVMETDYSRYAIVHELQQRGEQDVSPQLLQKFEELIPTMGLTKDMLAILPKSGECQEGTG
uniref:Lipocalin/cytosolic fatty-acid binding domain-containing protein n=1 Tax=Bubo bubo TaxID=30461 RepID=A0A8C0FNG5_BUBBB